MMVKMVYFISWFFFYHNKQWFKLQNKQDTQILIQPLMSLSRTNLLYPVVHSFFGHKKTHTKKKYECFFLSSFI